MMARTMRPLAAVAFRLLLLSPFAAGAAARSQELLTPESLWALRRVGDPALRPDGSLLLFTVRATDLAANAGETTTWLLDLEAEGAEPRQVAKGGSPFWSPGGAHFAVVTKSGIEVHALDAGGTGSAAAAVVVDAGGPVANASWSPDGGTFAFTRAVQVDKTVRDLHPDLPKATARVHDTLLFRHWDEWEDGTCSHLFTLRREQGSRSVDLMPGERADTPMPPFGGAEQIAWSPDGKHLCYTAKKVEQPARSTDSSLWLVAAGGGAAVNLTPELPGFDQEPAWSPDGTKIAFCSMARGGFEADRLRLFVHDRASGKNAELLSGFDASVHDLEWSRDGASLFFTVETEGTTQLYRTSLAEPKAVPVTKGRHALSSLQIAPDGRTVYALRSTTERPPEVVRIDVASGAIAEVTDVNGDAFAKLRLPSVEAEWFAATDGARIHAWIVKPPDFDPAKKHPMLLVCQGGPQSMVGQGFSFRWNFHLMAAKGYVVAAVNRRGLPGFGQKWNDDISRDWGGQAMQDLLSVTDQMQQKPWIDRARCAAVGASFGGYTVYWLMGNAGDRFACMISHCGVFDLESMYLSTEELWFVDWDLGGPFWQSPEVARDYERFSPNRFVQNWRTPLLVIHGDRDYRVPQEQGLMAFTAAQLRSVPSRLLTFPDEGHWVMQPQNGVLWQREFFGWCDRWCGKQPAGKTAERTERNERDEK